MVGRGHQGAGAQRLACYNSCNTARAHTTTFSRVTNRCNLGVLTQSACTHLRSGSSPPRRRHSLSDLLEAAEQPFQKSILGTLGKQQLHSGLRKFSQSKLAKTPLDWSQQQTMITVLLHAPFTTLLLFMRINDFALDSGADV